MCSGDFDMTLSNFAVREGTPSDRRLRFEARVRIRHAAHADYGHPRRVRRNLRARLEALRPQRDHRGGLDIARRLLQKLQGDNSPLQQ